MKQKSVAFGLACLALVAFSLPASAAVSDKTRKACEAKAEQVRPALRAGEKEAFIANCLADASAEQSDQ